MIRTMIRYSLSTRTKLSLALFAALACSHSSAMAASDGSLGADSTGTSTVTVTVPTLVKITGLANITFGTWSGSGDLNDDEDVCVYTNLAAGTYYITASGSGAADAFTLASGGDTLAYRVYFNDEDGTTGEAELTATTKSAQQTGAHVTSQTCVGGDTGNYHVQIEASELSTVPAGSYSGTLSLLVEPN